MYADDLFFNIYYDEESEAFAGEIEIKEGEMYETETDATDGHEHD
jgi:hypothetical protein